jgi:multidrug resistance efflux pump
MRSSGINGFYWLIGLLFVAMLYISSRYFKGSSGSTVGITYAKEYKISSEKSSLVKTIHVVAGQQVKDGQLLIELSSTELEMDIEKLTNKLSVLKSEQHDKSKLVQSEIDYERAETNIRLEEIDADLAQLKSEMKMNQQLTKEFTAADTTRDNSQTPQHVKIRSLQEQRKKHERALDIKIKDLLHESATDQSLLINQIKLQERELELLKDEQKALSKYASSEGVVENVYVKNGEHTEAFTALLSINPTHPTTVVGYMIGKKAAAVPVGADVSVEAYEQRSTKVSGKVIGYGSVVELPEILQKSTAVKAFGREVFIEIAPDNEFATGEKVLIR